ncbi:hypothetical protein HY085_00705 [Candidatus Gottesmanbacteria bacterium]|nr:hypothetical protein [Candidatus Gottesmanbacteria bacterium]
MSVKEHLPEEHPITCFYSHASGSGIENEESWSQADHTFSSYDPAEIEEARKSGMYKFVIFLIHG